MKSTVFAALAILAVTLGSLTLAPAANATWVPNGHGYSWYPNSNG